MAKITPRRARKKSSLLFLLQSSWVKLVIFLRQNPRFTSLLVLASLLTVFIILGTLLPSIQPFEGRLSLNSLGFTSTEEQPLLRNVLTVSQITIQKELPATFLGKFTGEESQLKNLQELELKPLQDQDDIFWRISSPKDSRLQIKTLELSPQTQIKNLIYDSFNKKLSMEIYPQDTSANLSIGSSPNTSLDVDFNGYTVSQVPNLSSFSLVLNSELNLPISKPIILEIKFKETPRYSFFWGDLAVKDVQLKQFEKKRSDYNENYLFSAIAGGTIRLAQSNYNLEDGQFITFKPQDSITTLLNLRLTSEGATTLKTSENQTLQINAPFQGLQVDVSGKTKQIEIGLNPKIPIAKLQASFLEGFMPRDAFIALIAFLSSLIATLIGWMWELLTAQDEED
jgi:hypothetical protein